jgi:sulfur transfer complex TusBCD TusB component (DsrH family)
LIPKPKKSRVYYWGPALAARNTKGGTVSNYVFIESRSPLESPDDSFLADTAASLKRRGNDVTVFLVQNAVLAARKLARESELPRLLESGITVLADDFSLRERGIQSGECAANLKIVAIDHLVDLLVQENTKAIWH